jgi:short-subunit dehydrogenase
MDHDFTGKTVLITGASAGVGAATARQFAARGANLLLVARGRKGLDTIADELGDLTRVETISMDMTDTDACVNLLKKAEFEFGAVNVLVNNAGCHVRGPVESVSPEDHARMVDVNLKAPICLSRLAIPYLRKARGAAIINVASLAGHQPAPGASTYCATKFGLRIFTFALAEELAGCDIKLAVVSPGPIDTGFIMENIDVVTDLTFSQPLSSADEVAQEIIKLATNRNRERSMPPLSGLLTTTVYLIPALGRLIQPFMEIKGRRVKRKLKARQRALAED